MQPKGYADAHGLRLALARTEADFARRLGIDTADTVSGHPLPDRLEAPPTDVGNGDSRHGGGS